VLSGAVLFVVLKLVVALCFLVPAAFSDVRSRLVSNKIWLMFVPVALVLAVVEAALFTSSLTAWGLLFGSYGATIVCSLVAFRFGWFGGADVKCFICLGLLFPFFPLTFLPGFLLVVFLAASLLCFGVQVVSMFCYNVVDKLRGYSWFDGVKGASTFRKLFMLFSATRVRVERLNGLFWLPREDGGRLLLRGSSDPVVVERLQNGVSAKSFVWAERTVPFILYLTFGLVVVSAVWVTVISLFFIF
jgi:Flp pilus assembly protein protease CpaA